MNQSPAVNPSRSAVSHCELEHQFRSQGYLLIPNAVSQSLLSDLHAQLQSEFARTKAEGRLFEGGGTFSGHLNCFPGREARAVYGALESAGVIDRLRALSPKPLRMPNVGCNFNLPQSSQQNEHIDGLWEAPFLVVNVAAVDTSIENGAMEVMPRTHLREYKYWQLLASRPERLRLRMSQGDAVIRTSTLWHRGMQNFTQNPRPMLAFTWEDGGSSLADPFSAHEGAIRFFPNRFRTDWLGRLRERAFVAAPRLGRAVRAASSLFAD